MHGVVLGVPSSLAEEKILGLLCVLVLLRKRYWV